MIIIKQCLIPINTTSHIFLNYRLSYFLSIFPLQYLSNEEISENSNRRRIEKV